MSAVLRMVGVVLVIPVLAGCYSDHSDLERRIEQVKARDGEEVEPLPVITETPGFTYAAQELRDPFQTPREPAQPEDDELLAEGEGPQPDFNRRRENLEAYELDSLEMVGTFDMEGQIYGLVADPDGLLHRVRVGNYLGRNHGQVVAVHDDRIALVELLPQGRGRYQPKDAALALDEQ